MHLPWRSRLDQDCSGSLPRLWTRAARPAGQPSRAGWRRRA